MELDLTQLIAWGKTIVAALLALVAAITAGPSVLAYAGSKLKAAIPTTSPSPTTDTNLSPEKKPVTEPLVSSDKLPPVGFQEHVNTILGAAPYANSDTRLEYLSKGLTEAQTLKAEVARMGELNSPAPSKELKS